MGAQGHAELCPLAGRSMSLRCGRAEALETAKRLPLLLALLVARMKSRSARGLLLGSYSARSRSYARLHEQILS